MTITPSQQLRVFAILCWASILPTQALADELVVYPVIEGMPRNTDFTVRVRAPGHEWQTLPAYLVKVTKGVLSGLGPQNSSMACFDFSGTVDVSITYNVGEIRSVRIRPVSVGITPLIDRNTIAFSLSEPRNLSVEVNGDIFHNLQLFAGPVEASRPDPADPDVIYFDPGVHQIGTLAIPSGKTVYLAGGALVEGSFLISHADSVRIRGRGILSQSGAPPRSTGPRTRRDAILIEFSRNIEVDGIIVAPASYTVLIGESQNVAIRNIKSFSAGGNNDGIDVFSSSSIVIDGVFMRNSDDTIAIYGHRWNYYGDTSHITVRNSTLWADVAHPILVGTHGDSTNPDTLEDLNFVNIDILDQREPQLDYQGCMSLNAGDSNLIRNVRFENIRVEDFGEGQLVNFRVFYNRKYNTSPGRGVENVLVKDVTYTGIHANPSVIEGYDESRSIKHVIFENLQINGRVIFDGMPGKPPYYKTGDMARIFVGDHVEDVVFRK